VADRAADQRQTDAGVSDDGSLAELTERWRTRQMTNLDYLLRLNTLAGRRAGDHAFAPMLPWVLDFSMPPEPDMDTLTVSWSLTVALKASQAAGVCVARRSRGLCCGSSSVVSASVGGCSRVAGSVQDQVAAGKG
jgi:Beige/BEACH domain